MNDTISKYDLMSVCTVSRETIDRLEVYAGLLEKWNSTINLVSKNTINQMWKRHFLDSAQLWTHIPSETKTLVDIGSGAGFAGLVLAIIGMEKSPNMKFTLIECDSRKCAFMRNVSREINLDVQIITKRITYFSVVSLKLTTQKKLAIND